MAMDWSKLAALVWVASPRGRLSSIKVRLLCGQKGFLRSGQASTRPHLHDQAARIDEDRHGASEAARREVGFSDD
jgi:hypothetical protein